VVHLTSHEVLTANRAWPRSDLILRAANGSRERAPDDRLRAVSKDDLRPGMSALDAGVADRTLVGSPASEQSAHHTADQSNGAANTAVTVSPTAATTGRTVAIGFLASARIRC
jgi:hypothetical protein